VAAGQAPNTFVGGPVSSARGGPASVTGGRGRICSSRLSTSLNLRMNALAVAGWWRASEVKVMQMVDTARPSS